MNLSNGRISPRRGRKRFVALNMKGTTEPEFYEVSEDVFEVVRKMLAANQALGHY